MTDVNAEALQKRFEEKLAARRESRDPVLPTLPAIDTSGTTPEAIDARFAAKMERNRLAPRGHQGDAPAEPPAGSKRVRDPNAKPTAPTPPAEDKRVADLEKLLAESKDREKQLEADKVEAEKAKVKAEKDAAKAEKEAKEAKAAELKALETATAPAGASAPSAGQAGPAAQAGAAAGTAEAKKSEGSGDQRRSSG